MRLCSRVYQATCAVGLLVLLAAAIHGHGDPYRANESPAWFWLLVAGLTVALWRCFAVGVTVANGEVRVHNWLRNRRLPVADIVQVQLKPYDGLWLRGSSAKSVTCVTLVTRSHGNVTSWGLLYSWTAGRVVAARLAHLVEVPVSVFDRSGDPL